MHEFNIFFATNFNICKNDTKKPKVLQLYDKPVLNGELKIENGEWRMENE